jgi:Tfp pilus assembly protein PilF
MVAFTADQFGFPKITRALKLWGAGKTTAQVIQEAFGLSAKDYDARYHAWQMARLSRYDGQYLFDPKSMSVEDASAAAAAAPQSAPAHVNYAVALLRAKKAEEARREIDAALKVDPADRDAHFVASKLAGATHDFERQETHLSAVKAAGGDGYAVEMGLAEVAEARKDRVASRVALEAAHRFDPTQVDPLRALYDLASTDKRDADALVALREVARLDQHDRRAYRLLLGTLVSSRQWDEAKRVGQAALYVDVESAEIHVDYARALAATGDHVTAAFELESALLCEAKPPERATTLALLAGERLALGDPASAHARRDEALKLDPDNAAARALKL